ASAGLTAQRLYDRHAAMPRRDCQVGRRFGEDQLARASREADQRRPEEPRSQRTEAVILQLLDLEGQPKHAGKRDHLIAVTLACAEQRPDAERWISVRPRHLSLRA